MVMRVTRICLHFFIALFCGTCASFYTINTSRPFSPITTDKPVIFFDLGEVLIGRRSLPSLWHLGLYRIVKYAHEQGLSVHELKIRIKDKFYWTLNKISNTEGNSYGAKDYYGCEFPHLMCQWLDGTKNVYEIRHEVLDTIKTHPEWFSSKSERKLMSRMARMLFTPHIFVKTVAPFKEGIELVKECKDKGYAVYVLSNWDPASFNLLRNKYAELFDLFDGVIISGSINKLKPAQELYRELSQVVHPTHAIVIDDQPENIQAARACGMTGILCKKTWTGKPNFDVIRNKLNRLETVQTTQSSSAL